jgi:hypothetical protein
MPPALFSPTGSRAANWSRICRKALAGLSCRAAVGGPSLRGCSTRAQHVWVQDSRAGEDVSAFLQPGAPVDRRRYLIFWIDSVLDLNLIRVCTVM